VELAGPLPAEIQNFLQFTAGIPFSSKQPNAAMTLIKFLTSSTALSTMKLKGFE
jgi:hypothetical protein